MTYKKDIRTIRRVIADMDTPDLEDLMHCTRVAGKDPRARATQIWRGRRKIAEYFPHLVRLSVYSLDIWHTAATEEYHARGL